MVKRKAKSKSKNVEVDGRKAKQAKRNNPDVIYTQDGATFFPCKTCDHAFSEKYILNDHSKRCSNLNSPNNKENFAGSSADELNNNDTRKKRTSSINLESPRMTRSQLQAQRKSQESTPESNASSPERKPERCITNHEIDAEKLVKVTGSVPKNINSVSPSIRRQLVDGINKLLDNTMIKVYQLNDCVVVELQASKGDPVVQLTSHNLDRTHVELRMLHKEAIYDYAKTNRTLNDILDLLENNFIKFRTFEKPSKLEGEIAEDDTIRIVKVVDEPDLVEIVVEDEDVLGSDTIVLEDWDIHICKQCGAVHHSLEDLINHDKYEHRSLKRRYSPAELEAFDKMFRASEGKQCPICFKEFTNKCAWPRHMISHSDVRKYECSICKKKFTRDDHRKIHERRHVVEVTKTENDDLDDEDDDSNQ